MCPKLKDMGLIRLQVNEMNEKMSFKMGVKFAVPVYMCRIFSEILYEARGKNVKN